MKLALVSPPDSSGHAAGKDSVGLRRHKDDNKFVELFKRCALLQAQGQLTVS